MHTDHAAIAELAHRFFAVFDNRAGRTPDALAFEALFVPGAQVVTHAVDGPQFATPGDFVRPRIALLTSGALVDFHEWETDARTEVLGTLAVRRSTYAKAGVRDGRAVEGSGVKQFQFARTDGGWRIVCVSWIDGAPPAGGASH